ncbi:RHS repeat protein [Sinomicrobium kalidii]|uniref:RHS repeat domain-containing protein n=1 Tax=Sinomicrobium kalidii TaxID=2900738 RepID=UPI001E41213B|nr:RHS repeat domain-containing protein [Sinomicrobium kalidii]UGU18145.1 RHS repeat protein [Sinomicrobium kalidii]
MMKPIWIERNALTFILILGVNILFSQDGQDFELPNFTPPSPTAYELGRFGEVPIGLFTGAPNVAIPLADFKSKSVSVPISLNYSSNGIRVDQLSTKVGLGWNLFAGGVISRTVNQNPDELRGYQHPEVIDDNFRTRPWTDYFFDMSQQVSGISQPIRIDGEPDVFSFNFLGRTGKFTFNNQKQIVLLDNMSLKVVYNPEGENGFLITDEQGMKYYFKDKEETRMDAIGGQTEYNNIGHYVTTSWSLSRIENPNNSDIIYFEYDDEDYQYVASQSQHAYMYVDYPNNPNANVGCVFCNVSALSPKESPVIDNIMLVRGKRLSHISSNNPNLGSIDFQYNQVHSEVSDYSLLTSVLFKDKSDNTIENIVLNYTNSKNRMFLNEVTFSDPEKKYSLDYINLSGLPVRLSKSKDHWGFYNGKNNTELFPDMSSSTSSQTPGNRFASEFGGANREVDEEKAKTGLLKKITYPTKGYTEIEYESNTHRTSEEIDGDTETVRMVVTTDSNSPPFGETAESITLNDVSETGEIPLTISFGINYPSCFNEPHPPEADRKLFIEVENLTDPNDDDIIRKYGTPAGSNNQAITEDDASNHEYFLKLTANNDYRIKISVFYPCLSGDVRFTYQTSPSQTVNVNKKTGGLRVAKTTNYDNNNTFVSSKKYYYAAKDALDRSSGDISYMPNYFSRFTMVGACSGDSGLCCSWRADYDRINSNNINMLYRSSLQTTRYKYVTVSEDADDFSNGGIEHKFKLAPTLPGTQIFGTYSYVYSEGQRSWGDGFELEKTYFKSTGTSFTTVQKEINDYKRDTRKDEKIYGFKVSRKFHLPCRSYNTSDPDEQQLIRAHDELNVTMYYLYTNWAYLFSKTVKKYDDNGQNPVTTVTNYSYDNPGHYQLTKKETVSSEGKTIVSKNMYPQDIPSGSRTPAETKLINQHRIAEVIETENIVTDGSNNVFSQSIRHNEYDDFGNSVIQPKFIQSSKNGEPPENRIAYYKYDRYGNPEELSLVNGPRIVYLWGYNGQYPIAKIENATSYSSIPSTLITAAKNASNSGTEANLISALDDLREALPTAQVTTYTYSPLIGLSTITDPRGEKTTYSYDTFNRLQFIRDETNKLLEEYKYNYKN